MKNEEVENVELEAFELESLFMNHVVEGYLALYKQSGTARSLYTRIMRKIASAKA